MKFKYVHTTADGDIPFTPEEVIEWEAMLAANHAVNIKLKNNTPILQALTALDLKSIRALRANDVDLIAQYEAEAVALRTRLLK